MKDWRLADPQMQSPEEKNEKSLPQHNPDYHEYLDDEALRESLSNEGTQVPTRDFGDGFSVEMPSAFVATSTGWAAMPKRRKQMIAGAVFGVCLVAMLIFGSGSGPASDENITPIAPRLLKNEPSSVLKLSVGPRRSGVAEEETVAETLVTLVHGSQSGAVELEWEQAKTTTLVAEGIAYFSSPRPGSKEGTISVCTSMNRVPGATSLVHMLSSARGSLTAWLRSVGKPVLKTAVQTQLVMECSGELLHLYSHGEDALVCLKGDKILELKTEKVAISVLSQVEGHLGSPLEPHPCDGKAKPDTPPADPWTRDDMWQTRKESLVAWFRHHVPGDSTGFEPSRTDVTNPKDGDLTPTDGSGEGVSPLPHEGPRKDCVFIHGVGQTPEKDTPAILNGSYPNYWGKVHEYTKQCDYHVFLNVDTVYRGWDNVELQKQVCAALTYDPALGKSHMSNAENKLIFTHSMGNMMLAGAIESGLCSIDKATSSWYEVSGPMLGSKMAAVLGDICSQTGLYKYVVTKLGFCLPEGGMTPAYRSLVPDYPGLNELAATIQKRLTGALCGTSAYGITSIYSVELEAVAELAGFEQLNDGVVAWSSCNAEAIHGGTVAYKKDYRSPWYAATINHIDSECYNGDGYWGDDRKPCSWYALRN